jgi:acetyl esterase/lipase
MRIDRRSLIIGSLATGLAARSGAALPPGPLLPEPDEWRYLWPDEPPGRLPSPLPVEVVRERSTDPAYNDRAVFHVRRPRLAIFRPAQPNGASALITPGGSYARVVMDKEGFETARWLAARGVTAFVLFYRLALDGWEQGASTSLCDALRAIRLVRADAAARNRDPARTLVIGFSAGGHVAADLSVRHDVASYAPVDAADRHSARPDATALLYPVILLSGPGAHPESAANLLRSDTGAVAISVHTPSVNVTEATPPCFLVHAEDDPVIPVINTLAMRDELRAHNVSVETHLFPDGGHGFGIRLAQGHSVAIWPELMFAWGRRRGVWA